MNENDSGLLPSVEDEEEYEELRRTRDRDMAIAFVQVILVISFFFCGTFQLVLGFQGAAENRRLKQSCTVAATAAKTEEKRGSVKGLRGTEDYCDHIYAYSYEGRDYTAKWRVSDGGKAPPDIVDIFIDPVKPSQYRIIGNERDTSGNYRFGAIMLTMSLTMGIVFRLIGKRKKKIKA